MSRVPMTVLGAEKLRIEVQHLKSVVRPQIIRDIAEARAHGDLRENAEYAAAKEQQGFTEGRIKEIEGKLSEAQVIDVTKIANTGRVIFGSTATLINVETEEKVTYRVVGDDEADLKSGTISISSPFARAMIGKEIGDVFRLRSPSGEVEYEIEKVEHI